MKNTAVLFALIFSSMAIAVDEVVKDETKSVKVKYKESGRIDFESLLIEGERKKPELSVVTGNTGEKDNGIMLMRTEFADMMANDFGEVIE
jgi:hypothetical protein